MSKQLKKLSYEPETITLDVSSAITTDSGSLTISQIKVLLENAKNTITYQTSANYSEVLHLAQADYENVAAPKATYTADYYDSSTNVYYKHIIVVSYNTLFNSATWVFVSAPMVSGSSSDLQEKLVSGTNIKTLNNNSLLGSGNLAISEFPERSEEDATLAQIAGVNSNGLPDVGKVKASNMDSGSATAGQVPVADGSGGVAWGNKQNTLTASSINDGTIAKAIGFDSSNNLVKGTVGGGGGTPVFKVKITDITKLPINVNYCYFYCLDGTVIQGRDLVLNTEYEVVCIAFNMHDFANDSAYLETVENQPYVKTVAVYSNSNSAHFNISTASSIFNSMYSSTELMWNDRPNSFIMPLYTINVTGFYVSYD